MDKMSTLEECSFYREATPLLRSKIVEAATYAVLPTPNLAAAQNIPTLSEWGQLSLALVLAGLGYLSLRNRSSSGT